MFSSEIQSILQWGGPAALLIILLVTAVVFLWRYSTDCQNKLGVLHDRNVDLAQMAVRTIERSTITLEMLSKTEEQRGAQVTIAFSSLLDQVNQLERMLSDAKHSVNINQNLHEDTRAMIRELSKQTQSALETVVATISQSNEMHRRWEETGRNLANTMMQEIARNREVILSSQRSKP